METKRRWRAVGAALAGAGLVLTLAAPAAAQSLDELPSDPGAVQDLLDAGQLEDLLAELGLGGDASPQDVLDALEGGDDDTAGDPAPPADGTAGDVPAAGLGGFIGEADAQALRVGVGLPAELAEPLAPLFEGLGIDGTTDTIEIDLAATSANLQRAAQGEEVEGLAEALLTNLLLDSEAAGAPGSCTGGETVPLPDEDTPVLTLTVLDIDCGQDDERAFAEASIVGASLHLGNLIDLAGAEDLRDGLDQVLAPVNDELLAAVNDACPELTGPIAGGLDALLSLPDDLCDAVELQLENVFDVEVPLLDAEALTSTSAVVTDDDRVTATATSGFATLQLGGLLCINGADGGPLEFSSTATSDAVTGSGSTSTTEPTVQLCPNPPLLQILDAPTLLDSIEIAGQGAGQLLAGELEAVTEVLEEALATLLVDTEASLSTYADVVEEGAGATAASGLRVAELALFRGIEPLAESPLGDVTVSVVAMGTHAGANAAPAQDEPPPIEPEDVEPVSQDLPRTGAGAGTLTGLAALGAAFALRRRRDA